MKRLKFIVVLAALLTASLILVGCGNSNSNGESGNNAGGANSGSVTLKLGHVGAANAEHPWEKYALKYADEVEKATEGRVKIKTYPASQLGGDREVAESIQNGTGDLALVSTIAMGNFVPKLAVWDLPFIWPTDNTEVDKILEDSDITKLLMEETANKKINILGFFENDWRGMTSNKKLVRTPADLAAQKIRVVENKPSMDYFKRVGAIPTPMSWSETYTALQQGTVDAQDNGAVINYGVSIWDVQKYYTNLQHIYCPMPLIISDAALAKISDEDKEILKNLAVEVGREQRAYSRQMNADYTKEMAEKMTVVEKLSPEEIKAWQESAEGTYKALEGDIGKDLIDMMLALRK